MGDKERLGRNFSRSPGREIGFRDEVGYLTGSAKFGDRGSGKIRERKYLEKFIFEWDKLVEEDYNNIRSCADEEIQKIRVEAGAGSDLSAQFNDPQLNTMVIRKGS